ncbi:MAG: hypothetical protein FWH14_04405 [Oscillospiraceae bacterium]|nr:hypothetical protein [Oscillospiraceae bacterium]
MAKTAIINVRTDPEIREFDLYREIPNETTIAAMKEADDIISGKIESKSYSSFQDMLADALEDEEEG